MNFKISNSVFLIVSLLASILLISSCSENEPTNPGDLRNNIIVDFQKGFYSDSVLVLVNNNIVFSGSITTDHNKEFARRIEIMNALPNSRIQIELINNNASIEEVVNPGTVLLINFNRYKKVLEKTYSDIIPTYDSMHVNDFKDLSFIQGKSLIWASVYANSYITLGSFNWHVVNKSYYNDIKGINTLFAELYPIEFNLKWLTLPCWGNWDGVVNAGDTVNIFFVFENYELGNIDSLCRTYMDVEIAFSDSNQNLHFESVDSLLFICAH
jgi:hypothetical protein